MTTGTGVNGIIQSYNTGVCGFQVTLPPNGTTQSYATFTVTPPPFPPGITPGSLSCNAYAADGTSVPVTINGNTITLTQPTSYPNGTSYSVQIFYKVTVGSAVPQLYTTFETLNFSPQSTGMTSYNVIMQTMAYMPGTSNAQMTITVNIVGGGGVPSEG